MSEERQEGILPAKARRIAEVLGWEEAVIDAEWNKWREIHNGHIWFDGDRLYGLHYTEERNGRVRFSGAYPSLAFKGWDETLPQITVSPKKLPEQMAADIQRRLLPDYDEAWNRSQKRAMEDAAYELARTNYRDYLLRGIPGAYEVTEGQMYGNGGIEVRYGKVSHEIKIRRDLSAEKVVALITYLNELEKVEI